MHVCVMLLWQPIFECLPRYLLSVCFRLRLFLISTKAGSLGVNLIGANRVVIFDACWNPTHDLQSIFRTYRYGQTKPVFVYRLVAEGTMEQKIYDRQVTKQSLSLRVIDEKQIGRHFTYSQLQELFNYTPTPLPQEGEEPEEAVCEVPTADLIFARILEKLRPKWVVKYHTHDSLLEHIYDEELSKEEQDAAWKAYNEQKDSEVRAYNIASGITSIYGTGATIPTGGLLPTNPHIHAIRLLNDGLGSATELNELLTRHITTLIPLTNNSVRILMTKYSILQQLSLRVSRELTPSMIQEIQATPNGRAFTNVYNQYGETVKNINKLWSTWREMQSHINMPR